MISYLLKKLIYKIELSFAIDSKKNYHDNFTYLIFNIGILINLL